MNKRISIILALLVLVIIVGCKQKSAAREQASIIPSDEIVNSVEPVVSQPVDNSEPATPEQVESNTDLIDENEEIAIGDMV